MGSSSSKSYPGHSAHSPHHRSNVTYQNTINNERPPSQILVRVPHGVMPGQQFFVSHHGVRFPVVCPQGVRPGDEIHINIPASNAPVPNIPPPPPYHSASPQFFNVTVPEGVRPGQSFNVQFNGQLLKITCPHNTRPGMQIRVTVPHHLSPPPHLPPPSHSSPPPFHPSNSPPASMQTYEVVVPPGVRPGQPFAIYAGKTKVMVNCPPGVGPGQKIRFQLPSNMSPSNLQTYKVNYEKDGWVRCVQGDLKFHWVRQQDDNNSVEQPPKVSIKDNSIGFVRLLTPNSIELIPAEESTMETTVSYLSEVNLNSLIMAQGFPFTEKVEWFFRQVNFKRIPWENGHIRIQVRRETILEDSIAQFSKFKPNDFFKIFRFEFIGEPGRDAGGVAREWFHIISEELFNPNFGLFKYSTINQMCVQINPTAAFFDEEYLEHFRFAGQFLGKALFDRQIVRAHLVRPLYKHILAWPVVFSDLEQIDHEIYESIQKLFDMEDVSPLYLDFTTTEDILGEHKVVELIEDGANIELTNDNLDRYIEAVLKYRLLGQIQPQLKAFLEGFYQIIPEPLLTIFDFQELELLFCGIPEVDIQDWKDHTVYRGEFAELKENHQVIQWFWEVVEHEFTEEQRGRLLQFSTGTSGVPAQGFGFLQGNDGNIRLFTIQSVSNHLGFPRSHTCFNRIDLPLYQSKKDLKKFLSIAIQLEATGFSDE